MSGEVSLEKKIVAAGLHSRSAFFRIEAASSFDDSYTPYSGYLLKCFKKFYDRDTEAKCVDRDVVLEWIKQDMPAKNQELYSNHLKECSSLDVSSINVADVVVQTKRKHLANQLATALLERKDDNVVSPLIDNYQALGESEAEEEDEQYNNDSVESMVAVTTDPATLIKLLPNELDKVVKGKTKRQHHIVLFARPEAGKSAQALTFCYGFCLQGLDTIYFENEDPIVDTRMRAMCCFTGMTEEEIKANPVKAQALLDKRGWKHLRFIPINPGSPREIDKYVGRYAPACIIVNQIRNLYVGAETRVNQLEMAATSMRNIGKKRNCLVVSVTQAGDSADQKMYLDIGDVDFSNTGIPAQADLLLGVGLNRENEVMGIRGMSTPKNKIGGVHMHFAVKIRTDISRLEDL